MRADIDNEIDFIHRRTRWLQQQHRWPDGTLVLQDHRDEAGMLSRRVEEIEREYDCP